MRPDMAKVIVERPRYGSRMRGRGKGYWKKHQGVALDELPKREGIKAHCGSMTKSLNEHLAPLRRFLYKQVGRPWDAVFAEICTHISRNSAVQDHVRDHVADYVAVKVIAINGVLHEASRWGRPVPLEGGWRYPTFYVCPKTGLLKKLKSKSRHERRRAAALPFVQVPVDFEISFVRYRGVWLRVRFETFPKIAYLKPVPLTVFDALLQAEITRAAAVGFYGRAALVEEARRASRQEIRTYCEPLKAPNLV